MSAPSTKDVITAWRLVKSRHAWTAFEGEGARAYGGRWNSPGVRVAYASETAAHAVLEVLVHLQSSAVLGSYHLVSVRFPSGLVNALDVAELPPTWAESPPPAAVRAIGDEWVRGGSSAVLRVPSVIVEGDHNYLLNPAHPEFAAVNVQPPRPYLFDPRLLGRQR